ncbi:unnamed protein product [Lactuca saligna]|uniref:Uncharacterized protein n=1 Tax=Lactuca saligna TaxID=75948 RepID=A0AA36E5D4_LACSI|nr:unnamed protein product [Lactuca saligna]
MDVKHLHAIDTETYNADIKGEKHIPQGEPSGVESDDDVPLIKKRKETVDYSFGIGPSKKKHKQIIVSEMVSVWGVSIEVAKEFSWKHNIQTTNRLIARKHLKRIQKIMSTSTSLPNQIEHLNKFNKLMTKEKEMKENAITMDERSRFGDVLTRRKDPNPIIKVRSTKPKNKKMLTLHITRRGDQGLTAVQYTEVLFVQDLLKLRYEWL